MEPAVEAGPFVINLCSSSTPMALPRADLPELKRFNFFVSRRFEEGRERFRLHMGFFATQAEAENWLVLVREVYPGAWTGEAPGKKLRARAVAAAEEQAAHAAGPRPAAPEGEPARKPAPTVPILKPPKASVAAPAVARARSPATPQAAGSGARGGVAARSVKTAATAPPRAAKAVFADSNIKEVLAALDQPGRVARVPSPQGAPLTGAQVLHCLESRGPEAAKPAAFAVQLLWSVQPINVATLPPLAIFSAYSLYCVEGSREGRKWFGLRLGFFNDPISAKQVAGYVRSEFVSAAVVPVSAEERQRVSGESGAVAPRATRKARERAESEFKLFDADVPTPDLAASSGPASKPKAPVRELRPVAAAKRGAGGTQVHALERRGPQTLEETLEILGANELAIDDGRDTAINGRGSDLSRKTERSTPFARLLERLGERVRKN